MRVKLAVVDPAVLHYIPHRQTDRQTDRPRYFCSSRPHWYPQCTVMVKLAVVDPAWLCAEHDRCPASARRTSSIVS